MIPNCFYDVRSRSTEFFYYRTSFGGTKLVSYGTAFILKQQPRYPAAAAYGTAISFTSRNGGINNA